MYLHLGSSVSVPTEDIIGIFDLDNASVSRHTRAFLRAAEDEGMVLTAGEELPSPWWSAVPGGAGSGSTSPPWPRPHCWGVWSPCALERRTRYEHC